MRGLVVFVFVSLCTLVNSQFTLSNEQFIQPAALEAADGFGAVLAVDSGRAAVFAQYDDGVSNTVSGTGAVYTFQYVDPNWVVDSTILRETVEDASSGYGKSLCMSGGTHLLVGTSGYDDEFTNAGGVYAYEWNGSSWDFNAILTAPTQVSSGSFGSAIHCDGDRLVVADSGASSTSGKGRVHIFEWSTNQWTHTASIAPPELVNFDQFGKSPRLDGDTLVVGAVDQNSNDSKGSVYTFTYNVGNWDQDASKLSPASLSTGMKFGKDAISLKNGRLVVVTDPDPHIVYSFHRSGGAWVEDANSPITHTDWASNDDVAYSSHSIFMDNDKLFIGAKLDDGPSDVDTNTGAVYTYYLGSNQWVEQSVIRLAALTSSATLGTSLSFDTTSSDLLVTGQSYDGSKGAMWSFDVTVTAPTPSPSTSPTSAPTSSPTKPRYTLTKSNLKLSDVNGTRRALVVEGALSDIETEYPDGNNAPTTYVTKTVSSTERGTINPSLAAEVNDDAALLAAIKKVRCGQAEAECTASFSSRRVLQSNPVVPVELTFTVSSNLYSTIDGFNFDDIDFIEALRTELGLNNETTIEVSATGADIEIDIVIASEQDENDPLGDDLIQLAQNMQTRLSQTATTLATQLGGSESDITAASIDLCPPERDCTGNGTCNESSGVCECVAPYRGVNCESTCSCQNGGECSGSYCVCTGLYYGHSCQLLRDCGVCA